MAINVHLPPGERVYAIGDVHGRADLLAELLDAIRRDNDARPETRVRIILLGDLIDRGPGSATIVARCRELVGQYDCFIVLKGNHEAMMVDALQGSVPAFAFWLGQGGDATLASWDILAQLAAEGPSRALMTAAKTHVPVETIAWLASLPLYHQCGNCLFVHAGVRPGVSLAKQKAVDLLWIRRDFTEDTSPQPYVVIHGHTIDETGPRLRHGRLGIDTGAYRTGRLTAVGMEGEGYWSLSTGTQLDAPGNLPPLEQSVAAILRGRHEADSSSPRFAMRARTFATASAVMAVLLVIGTIAKVRWHDDNSMVIIPPAVTALPYSLEEKKVRRWGLAASGLQSASPAVSVKDSNKTSAAPAAKSTVALPSTGRVSYPRPGKVVASTPINSASARSVPVRAADGDPDTSVSRALVSPPRAPVLVRPLARSEGSVSAAVSVAPSPDSAPPPDLAIRVDATPPRQLPKTAKERVEAIDAIRLLRRQ